MRVVCRFQNIASQNDPCALVSLSFLKELLKGDGRSYLLPKQLGRYRSTAGAAVSQEENEGQKDATSPPLLFMEGLGYPVSLKTMCQRRCQSGTSDLSVVLVAMA